MKKDTSKAAANLLKMFDADKPERKTGDTKPTTEKKQEAATESGTIPAGYVLKEESKNARLQLLLKPSTLQELKARAKQDGESVNNLCNKIISDYLKGEN